MDNHYTKPRGYGSYTPNEIISLSKTVARVGGQVRPEVYHSFFMRLQQAWDVFTYKADALYWKERNEK